jgi:hypothetical protein
MNFRHSIDQFLAAVRRSKPDAQDATVAVLTDLVAWTEAQPDMAPLDRKGEKQILSVGLRGTDRILWSARMFPTSGVFITLLGWRSSVLQTSFGDQLRDRLSSLRSDGALTAGQELRVRPRDLVDPAKRRAFIRLLDDTACQLRAAA